MGVDQLVTGGDVDDPVVDSLTSDSVNTGQATIAGGETITQPTGRLGPRSELHVDNQDGLVGHWTLQDLDSGLEDQINDNDMSTTGSPTVVDQGPYGSGVKFGQSDYATIQHNGALSVENSDFTIEAYVRPLSLTDAVFIAQKRAELNSDTEMSYAAVIGGFANGGPAGAWADQEGSPGLIFANGSTFDGARSTKPAGAGPLYHVAYVFDADRNLATVYLNGKSYISDTISITATSNNDRLIVGAKLDGSGNLDFLSQLILSDLRIYGRKRTQAEIKARARLPYPESQTFRAETQGLVFGGSGGGSTGPAGPAYRYDDSKTEPHRILFRDYSETGDPWEVWSASEGADLSDKSNWTQQASDVISTYSDDVEPSDYVVESGTVYVYATNDTDGATDVFSGADFTTLSFDAQVLSIDEDCGAFRDDDGTVYLYTEDKDFQDGVSSGKLATWVADSPNGSFTEGPTALDVTDAEWKTGDPDIEKIDGSYWMFTDNTSDHPRYGTTLLRAGHPLGPWEIVDQDVKRGGGGDLDVYQTPEGIIGFSEFSDNKPNGIDVWNVSRVRF